MLANKLIQSQYPSVNCVDTVSFALQLMEDNDLLQIAVLEANKFKGLLSKETLLELDENIQIEALEKYLIPASINEDAYFLAAIKVITQLNVSFVAVINEQLEMVGVITMATLMNQVSTFLGNEEPGGIIVLEVKKRNFSFGEISRLIETNDAYITQLNTSMDTETGLLLVSIKINKSEISDIIATLQRYEYAVKYYFGVEQYANELKENYNEFMFYLNI
jgi:acetoin utilization protein AcuB